MKLAFILIRQFSFGLAIGSLIGGAPLMSLGFLFVFFVLWSMT